MKIVEPNIESIFNIRSEQEFEELALTIFRYQASRNSVYKEFLDLLRVTPHSVNSTKDIPFLPISFFKTHKVISEHSHSKIFKSSGTTSQERSNHFVYSTQVYKKSFIEGFNQFYEDYNQYTFLALLPSYLEQGDSSLIYMTNYFVEETRHRGSDFYLDNFEELNKKIRKLEKDNVAYVLLGVSYALLDFMEEFPQKMKIGKVMETGGMKGRRKELTKEELYQELKQGYGVETIHSEYGMTELLSQAYSKAGGAYVCPPWMRVLIRNTTDPFHYTQTGSRGLISIIDLANIHSCSFIATDDIGVINEESSFSVLGRFDQSELRGCNLMVT